MKLEGGYERANCKRGSTSSVQPYKISAPRPSTRLDATVDRLNGSSNYESHSLSAATMVPRLRVAVRVVLEDEYLAHLASGPPGPALYRGEKKFPVIIPNPQLWHIGHLAAEVRRQFRYLYGRDIGTIKYLSHGFDDCQLHQDLSVYEHLYDEGRARKDPSDQYVVVKAVCSPGRNLTEGSVPPDFDDPRYEHRPIPPVPIPSRSEASLNPGKRAAEEYDNQYLGGADFSHAKRPKLKDLDDADIDDEDVTQSVERDDRIQIADAHLPISQTIIQDSQSSLRKKPSQSLQQPAMSGNGPTSFPPPHSSVIGKASASVYRPKVDQVSDTSVDMPLPIPRRRLIYDPIDTRIQALLTPPSDASKKVPAEETKLLPVHHSGSKSLLARAISSEPRRLGTSKKAFYEMDEPEEIECSLMSPKSKLATEQKLSRASSGSKSSRSRIESHTPDRFRGTVSNSQVVKLMEDDSIQPKSVGRPQKEVFHGHPEHSSTAAVNGYDHRSDMFRTQNASTAVSVSAGNHNPKTRKTDLLASPLIALSLPESQWENQSTSRRLSNSVESQDRSVSPSSPKPNFKEHEDGSGKKANVTRGKASSPDSKNKAKIPQTRTVSAVNQGQKENTVAKPIQQRRRKVHVDDQEASDDINVNTARLQLDTKQSTPTDSPSEQLLEMQASASKPQNESRPKYSQKAKKITKKNQEKEESAKQQRPAGALKEIVGDGKQEQQKSGLDYEAREGSQPTNVIAIDAPTRSDTESKSPYARPKPAKGSIGLGFTNSPRRPSTDTSESVSRGQQDPFKKKSAVTRKVDSTNRISSEDSSHSDNESSVSVVATPSKQAHPEKAQTPYEKVVAKTNTAAVPQALPPATKPNSNIRSESPRDTVIPQGMTMEQYQTMLQRLAKEPPKPKPERKNAKAVREQKARVQSAKPQKMIKKEGAPLAARSEQAKAEEKAAPATEESRGEPEVEVAVAPAEEPTAKKKRGPKKKSAITNDIAPASGSTIPQEVIVKPAVTIKKEQQEPARQQSKATSTSLTTASQSKKAPQPAPAKPAQAAFTPSVKVTGTTVSEQGNRLKNLKNNLANKSAKSTKSSPLPQTFAAARTPVTREWIALDEDSSNDESSDDNDDIEVKGSQVINAAKPDQSTRTIQEDSDEDMDNDSDED